MILKIDTRERFDIITLPAGNFTTALAEELTKSIGHCRDRGMSAIICLENLEAADEDALQIIGQLHDEMYADNFSFVLCGVPALLKDKIQALEQADTLNIAPTLAEAIDIVSMEDVERELLGGE